MYIEEKIVNETKLWQVTTEYITQSPHRYIGALTFTENNKMGVGSATIISKNAILTAAHNIYDRMKSRENTNYKFYLAPHERTTTFYEIQFWCYPQQFKTCNLLTKGQYDYALMKLKTPVQETDFLALQAICQECKKEDIQLSIFGYPIKEPNYQPVDPYSQAYFIYQFGLISRNSVIEISFSDGIMKHFINTLGGQSGCPIIANNRIIAIHNGAAVVEMYNLGTLISKNVLNNLAYWIISLKADGFKVFKHSHSKYKGRLITIRNDIDKEEHVLDYSAVKDKKVLQVITNTMKSARFYTCLLYKSTVLRPEDTFSKILEEHFEENEKIELSFLKNNLRFYIFTTLSELYMNQGLSKLKYFEKYQQNQSIDEDRKFVIREIWQNNKILSQINRFIRDRISQIKLLQEDERQMIKSIVAIINILKGIPQKPGMLFRGISTLLTVPKDDNFSFKQFMTATPNFQVVMMFIKKAKYNTLCKLVNFTGKSTVKYSPHPQEESAILPFITFFPIKQNAPNKENIQKYEFVELSGPIYYSNRILLWISNPDNLSQSIQNQGEIFGFEFLYIPSLFIFKKWHMEYGWLLKWKETTVKIVINQKALQKDKTQYLYQQNPFHEEDDASRMRFLLLLYNEWGFKSDTLIYCNDPKDCKVSAINWKVNEKSHFTDRLEDIERFIQFD